MSVLRKVSNRMFENVDFEKSLPMMQCLVSVLPRLDPL